MDIICLKLKKIFFGKVKGIGTWPDDSSLNQVLKENKQNSTNTNQQIDDFLNHYVN